MQLTQILEELQTPPQRTSYGCAMIYYHSHVDNIPLLQSIHDTILPEDLHLMEEGRFVGGLEVEPHTTLLSGLHDEVSAEVVEQLLAPFMFGTVRLSNMSLFTPEGYEVLKLEASEPSLFLANRALKHLPHTEMHPTYKPHLTIAYLKPGTGQKYVDRFKELEFSLTPSYGVYSYPDDRMVMFPVKVKV